MQRSGTCQSLLIQSWSCLMLPAPAAAGAPAAAYPLQCQTQRALLLLLPQHVPNPWLPTVAW
jgi:hypothetical protein